MSKRHREWTDRFSDYLVGAADASERSAIEGHVAECGSCRHVLEELREVIARAAALEERQPERDLWPGISAAIAGPLENRGPGAQVIALPTASRRSAAIDPAGIVFTPPQLAAAAVILIAVSAVTTWWAGPGLGVRGEDGLATAADAAVTFVDDAPAAPDAMSAELEALESVLEAAREALDPNTVRVLERNLSVIEQAIADSREALALDPENHFLTQHLERSYERKLTYLRDAARVIEWAG